MLSHRVCDRLAAAAISLAVALMTAPAYAAGSNMPREQPLQQILDSVEGVQRQFG
jgi:type IV secretion system protein TrbC